MISKFLIVFIVSYLLGSVDFGIIISNLVYHKDVRQCGSGNAGTTNMLRTYGKKAAAMTVIGDFLKGTVSVLFARHMFAISTLEYIEGMPDGATIGEIACYIAVLGALLGHLYPIYFKFKGGKGVATGTGAMLRASPIPTLFAMVIFFAVAAVSRIVSLASITASVGFLIGTLFYFKFTHTFSVPALISAIVIPGIIIYAHRSNIKRLLNGTEYKFDKKK